jgi:hypothetical protein
MLFFLMESEGRETVPLVEIHQYWNENNETTMAAWQPTTVFSGHPTQIPWSLKTHGLRMCHTITVQFS